MKNKILIFTLISIIFIGIFFGGIWAFLYFSSEGTVDNTEATSEDGSASLSATFYDFSGGSSSGGVLQALIGGTAQRTHVSFELKATNTGQVGLTNIKPISPNTNMNGAFTNVIPLSTLAVGASNIIVGTTSQSCTSNTNCNTNEECCDPITEQCGTVNGQCFIALNNYASGTSQNNIDFTISLEGTFLNALGNPQTITSNPVTLTYDIRSETCTDGTTINSCVFARTGIVTDKPKYCNFVKEAEIAPSIINKASICGCPSGYEISGENCVPSTCSDGTQVNTCSTQTHEGTYGAFMYCDSSKSLIADCNTCGATTDSYGNPKVSCNPTTGRPSSAVYQTYTGSLSGGLGEA